MNYFLEIYLEERPTYIKVDEVGHSSLIEFLISRNYKIKRCSPDIWDYNIETGNSIEIIDAEAYIEFKERIKNEIQSKSTRRYRRTNR